MESTTGVSLMSISSTKANWVLLVARSFPTSLRNDVLTRESSLLWTTYAPFEITLLPVPEMLVSLYLQNKTLQPSHRKQLVVPRSFRSAEQASIMGFSFGYSTAMGVREETQPLLISLWTSQCEKPQWPLEMLQRDQSKKSENVPRSPLTHFLQSWKYDMWLYKTWT